MAGKENSYYEKLLDILCEYSDVRDELAEILCGVEDLRDNISGGLEILADDLDDINEHMGRCKRLLDACVFNPGLNRKPSSYTTRGKEA